MNDQEKFLPQFKKGEDLYITAEQARNPYKDQLRVISDEYAQNLEKGAKIIF